MATFTRAGTYLLLVSVADVNGGVTTCPLSVTVNQVGTLNILPASPVVLQAGKTQTFTATAADQFGQPLASPAIAWSIVGTRVGNHRSSHRPLYGRRGWHVRCCAGIDQRRSRDSNRQCQRAPLLSLN